MYINEVEWVANGLMIAFRANQSPYATMWYLMPSVGGEAVPFAPEYEQLHGTSDGFMIVDLHAGEIKFSNILQVQAFAPTVGSTIFTTDSSNFRVIYITPVGATFQLASIATPNNTPIVSMPDSIQAPQSNCGTAPTPRLAIEQTARITFTDGTPLNLRADPAGTLLTQLDEGTIATVVEGPVCANGYFWWRLEFPSLGTISGGWAAEGDANDYYLEPFTPLGEPQVQLTSTALPQVQIEIVTLGDGNCTNAPAPTGISNGQLAHTVDVRGTLAMRANLGDQYPSYQIPNNTTVNVESDGVCDRGFRMWRVSLTLDGQQVTGWVADGFGQTDYLHDGPAR
ncbi:MAG: hypothetical protein AAF846_23450 [Chloroflexota bacterium]